MAKVQFQQLWKNHPSKHGEDLPCKTAHGTPTYENQCAIRLSIALTKGGFNMHGYHKARCHQHGHGIHAARAQELADWLSAPSRLGKPKKFKKSSKENLGMKNCVGRKGIVFFQNFWGENNGGDHIDLWDGFDMPHGDISFFGRAQQVWFWEIKF